MIRGSLFTLFVFGAFGFELDLKCLSGQTTENGKFIMPFSEKMTYLDAINRCDGQGFIIVMRDRKKSFRIFFK